MTELPGWLDPLPGAQAMRAADAAAIAAGTPGLELMERAAAGLARVVEAEVPRGEVAVLCGKGNNGGDGYACARLLRARGRAVTVVAVAPVAELSGDARAAADALGGPGPVAWDGGLPPAAGYVDCLLGTGATGAPHGDVDAVIRALGASRAPVVAADVPSGVDANTGEVAGAAVRAAATATFALAKPGLWIAPGKAHAGRVAVVDIGLPARMPAEAGLLGPRALDALPRRGAASTKFTSGHVLVAGGSRGLTGAACLAAQAAARAGAGYVTAAVPASLEDIFEVKLTEVMTRGLPDVDGAHVAESAGAALDATRGQGALVLGPGLGRTPEALAFAREVARRADVGLVLDADGLNAHAGAPEALAARTAPTVLTPHAGELARLLEVSSAQVGARRLHHAREAARRTGAVVVLKGDDTLVAAPDGRVAISPGGAPGLATAGTGDVLSGICGALLAAGLDPLAAASAAVWIHLRAGQLAAEPHGPRGVIASDVLAAVPAASAG
jgi:NAD(P)H-hydrate epimerase